MPRFPMWRIVLDAAGIPAGHIEYTLTDQGRIHVEMTVYDPPDIVSGYMWQRTDDGHYLIAGMQGGCLAEYNRSGDFVSGPYPAGSRIAP